ncbi:MAG: hypothetical protein Q9220_004828 [cf. Caloplaca sp. 1 TL-2023]
MVRAWPVALITTLVSYNAAAAPQPVVVAPVMTVGFVPIGGGSNQTTVQPAITTPATTTTPHKKSFALTPHSESPAAGFEPASTPLAAVQPAGSGADDVSSYFSAFNAGISTIPGCFKTQTQFMYNSYTTTALIPCVEFPAGESAQLYWLSGTNPNPRTDGPGGFSLVPHPETSVVGGDASQILQAPNRGGGGGRGGNPLPEPETTVPGNDMSAILGGPGGSPPKDSPPQESPKATPEQTVGEPAPITAAPAVSVLPLPAQTPTIMPIAAPSPQPHAAGGQPVSIPIQPMPAVTKPPPIITVGPSTITADSSSHFVVGTQTLVPGGPAITHSGTVLSLPSSGSGVVFGPSTQEAQPAVATPAITVGGTTITPNSASQFVVGSQTLVPGGAAITHSGTMISLAPLASAAVVGGQTQDLTPPSVTPAPSITVGGQVVTANSASQFQFGGQTLKPGAAPVVINGQTVSLAPSGSAVVINGQTQNIVQPMATPLPVITVGGAKITGDSTGQYIISGETLAPGKSPITVDGQVLSIASSGNAVVFGPSTQAFATPPLVISTVLPALTVGSSIITPDASSNYVISGQTIHPGGSAITVDGTIISLAPSATALIVGGSTQALAPSSVFATVEAPLITLGSQVLHANEASEYVIGGQTLAPGHAITVSGTVISLAPGASDVVIGGSTIILASQTMSLSTGLPVLTIGSTTVTANAEGQYVISGQTIRPGAHAVTIDGQLVSLAANDSFLAVGTSTEILHNVTRVGGTVSLSGTASSTAMASLTSDLGPTPGGLEPGSASNKSFASKTESMVCAQLLPWRSALRSTRQVNLRRLQRSNHQQYSLWTHNPAYHSPAKLRQYPPPYPSCASINRPFATSPTRRKDLSPDDVPDPIPVKEEGKAESQDRQKDPSPSAEPSEESIEAKKTQDVPSSASTASSSTSNAKASGGSSSGGESGAGDGGRKGGRKTSNERAIQKPSVPEVYPQVMAIPIAKRPLFPGFYKAVTIRDPNVAQAIQEMMRRGQQYVGAFLFKDEASDKDVIDSIDEVHDVGVFAQVTSAFPVNGEEHSLTAVLYPHRRIKMSRLIPPNEVRHSTSPESARAPPVVEIRPVEDQPGSEANTQEKPGDVVASFEESSPAPQTREVQPYEPTAFLRDYAVSLGDVENLKEQDYDRKDPVIKAVTSELVNVFKDVANLNHLFRDQISTFSMSQSAGNILEEPGKLADFAAAVSQGEIRELQDVLETMNVQERLSKALMVLKKEFMNAQLQQKISKDVESKIQKRQREYWLMEQMKGIRRELGIESDGKDKMVEKFKEKASKLAMPEAVSKVFEEELNKLAHLEPAASEFNVTRNYLDWLTQIPWGQQSAENFGIKNAMTVLDEDHHGLKDVKDRILEFIAVGKLRGTVEGKILCFVGPPGVGKTSIGKSIARALNRQYYRFSVGGLTDVAEIKGHRRTYVGALPGRIIQALKKCQTENPLILIDEVDKIGRGHQGDPSSALLELLDPEQNNSFLDHYMDVPVDLSKVLFVCTANMTDTIPRPLLDRMEMIELSGYVADEKMAIAERYLAPAAKELSGLKDVAVNLDKAAIEELIKSYCRESGVRNLKKQIEKVYRKSALNIIRDVGEADDSSLAESAAFTEEGKKAAEASAKNNETTDVKDTPQNIDKETTPHPRIALKVPDTVNVTIDRSNLKDYVGPPVFTSDRLYESTPPGVAMGLAWTSMGGAALYVESILENSLSASSRPGLERTGNLKNVMRESTVIAYSFAKGFLAKSFPDNKFFEKAKVHLHCPEGAVQKDGPSAGVTMATSLLSLALGRSVGSTVAMTGELTVTGKVLRIGGLREKVVAARRAGAEKVVFPGDNLSDWLELPENIKEGIDGHSVNWYEEIFDLVFPDLDTHAANTIWQAQLAEPAESRNKKVKRKSSKKAVNSEEEEEDTDSDDD